MRKISLILLIITCIIYNSFTQESVGVVSNAETQNAETGSADNMKIVVGDDVIVVEDLDSITDIRVGNRGIKILESLEGKSKIKIETYRTEEAEEIDNEEVVAVEVDVDVDEEFESDDEDMMFFEDDEEIESDEGYYSYSERHESRRYSTSRNFRGHWSGFEIGFNNYGYENSMSLPETISYMTLDENRSINFNLNFSQLDIGFTRHFGIVTGLGVNWSNYRFDKGNSIIVGADGNISELIPGGSIPVKKSKFSILYLNVPAMLEVQIPAGYRSHLNLAAGVIGSLKLNAWTKIVYEDGEKIRNNGNYNLNLLRGGVTARVGYQNFMIYGTYFLTPWFRELQGPGGYNLEPFEIGLAFTIND